MSLTQAFNPISSTVTSLVSRNARIRITEPVSEWRRPVLKRLEELVQLPRGWDGYRAGPVGMDIAVFALSMLEKICDDDAEVPSIVPTADGEIQIEWHTHGGDVELLVRAPNDVLAWRASASTTEEGEELALTNDFTDVPDWIREILGDPGAVGSAAA